MRLIRGWPLLAASCIATLAGARDGNGDLKLPDIGSSAAAIMSPQDLHDYGAQMLQEMRAYGLVLDDALLGDYLTGLGYKLVSSSESPQLDFTFFVVRDEQINAFAAPGGFVAVNTGLITAMDTEDELAAVMAHEISHVQQNHILRAFENQKKMSIPIMLAMLGVLVASAHSRDDTGLAGIMAGTSLLQQNQINFTRGEEAEADRFGIQTLARAGFDPNAMAGAFQQLQKVMRVNGVDVPEFLLDHPLDSKRIAEAKGRAEQLGCPETTQLRQASDTPAPSSALNLALPSRHEDDNDESDAALASSVTSKADIEPAEAGSATLPRVVVTATACNLHSGPRQAYFELMRERTRVLSSATPSTLLTYYANNFSADKSFDTVANHYGYALTLLRTNDAKAARSQLRPLVDKDPTSLVLGLALASAEDLSGYKTEALQRYEHLAAISPRNRAVAIAFTESLLAQGDVKSAKRAVQLLRPIVERHGDDPELQKSYGRANALAGDKVRASEAFAEAAYSSGHAEDALNQLKALSKQSELSYYERSRIDARITQMTPDVLAHRKRDTGEGSDSLRSRQPSHPN